MERILITKEEYLSLLQESMKYQSLMDNGVGNWLGYSDSIDEFEDNFYNLKLTFEPVDELEFKLLYQPEFDL